MRMRRLIWHLAVPFFIITVLSIVLFSWFTSAEITELHTRQIRDELLARSKIVGVEVGRLLAQGKLEDIHPLGKKLGQLSATRITVIRADGTILSDSQEEPARMQNHADRPEIAEALRGGTGSAVRYSNTVRTNTMYVAVPVRVQGTVVAVVRAALPLRAIDETLSTIQGKIAFGGGVLVLLSGAVILLFSRRMAKTVQDLRAGAEHYARGDFSYRLTQASSEEESALAEAMESMARQLDERIRTILQQRNEQQAVLASMVEGIIACDTGERVLNINRAAAALFSIPGDDFVGKTLQEVIRNPDLQRFASRVLQEEGPVEGLITVRKTDDRTLQAHGAELRDASGTRIGAVIVLNDITQLRRLENIRRDFVSNVSHELKTPITSIKGFVETLLDGAMHDAADSDRFLRIISRETDRLHSIIEDLLSLSRIEQDEEREQLAREPVLLATLLASAVESHRAQAEERSVAVEVSCNPDLAVRVNATLMEQAAGNLIDNAIKYSNAGGSVTVAASAGEAGVRITVTDEGVGIAAEHLPRIFERFYRIDKARSRSLGSTGLGLAIVKHIVQAHGGGVDVTSAPGEGSTFTIVLPR